MTKIALSIAILAATLIPLLYTAPAHAQATRTWISGVGDDANPCSRTAPCKTFAGAISKTSTPGEINCLDPGGFGALTITNSIAILCGTAGEAGVLVSGTNGFTINAPTTAVVYLEGLDFEGLNASTSGIQITAAATVTIVNCRIRGFNTAGINVTPSSAGVVVNVIDSIIADNPGEGILVKPTAAASVRGIIDRTRVINNTGDGIFLNANLTSGNVKFSVRDSESANNGVTGLGVTSNGAVAQLQIDSTTATNNNTGIAASGTNAVARVTRSTVFSNTTGVNGAQVLSYGTNSINGNGTDGTPGTVAQQ